MLMAGAASCDITNELGTQIQGASVGGVAQSVRDPLEANALYLQCDDAGVKTSVLLISCDFGGLEPRPTATARKRISQTCGIVERDILIGATHTGGPSIIPTNYHKQVDQAYLDRLNQWLADVSQKAINNAQPAQLAWGQGQATLGYNRRCCWADGSHSMFGDTKREDFIGMEGPNDPTHTVLAIRDLNGQILGVLQANTAHPCTFYGADFYSADFPGLSRKQLRDALGEIPILFFNGALGDQSSNDVTRPEPGGVSKQYELARLAHTLTAQTLHLLYHASWHEKVTLQHAWEDLSAVVRLPDEATLDQARALLARVDAGETCLPMDVVLAHGATLLAKRYGEHPVDQLPIHAVRINELALVSEPCELFCQYGLDIRRRSPAKATAILGITDGYHGYCPTPTAIHGGGYSAQPIYWTRFDINTGDQIVDTASKLLRTLWR